MLTFFTLVAGGLVLAGIAYPEMAPQKGWPVGAISGGIFWTIWYGFGALAYLAGTIHLFAWWAIVIAPISAVAVGFCLTSILSRNIQLAALIGPILANLWYLFGK